MIILTIESTCDETAAAVLASGPHVLGAAVATQTELHARFQGVVPEVAARAHVQRILPVIDEAIRQADIDPADLDAIAVANTPGLAGSLMVGLTAAKTLAVAWNKPLVAVNHLQAHIYACQMSDPGEIYPCVGLIVSGGHTSLYACHSATELDYLGGTIDDAAGEAFDKVGAMLGLPFPGGPSVSRAAAAGNPKAHDFPRSLVGEDHLNFSFSGLKTAVRYCLVGPGKQDFSQLDLSEQQLADLCASFEQAVVDCLVAKSRQAIRQTGFSKLCVGGGVAANGRLRAALAEAADRDGFGLVIAPPDLCTDNAVMGAVALEQIERHGYDSLDVDIHPGLQRGY
ncbi:tRNA (adenosine(37)-N6)-threonylcarbamoyltransferase complex transferase subunit TsaD [Rosistilla oblonga]|uniref:tRNA (adenosine(37)-N6)-threonylcarbamoyltransferase complex transferase subunit TsaD n=1 Tax=Rosistilla oblonga TaxID=2527990 RepID=UPI003A9742F7